MNAQKELKKLEDEMSTVVYDEAQKIISQTLKEFVDGAFSFRKRKPSGKENKYALYYPEYNLTDRDHEIIEEVINNRPLAQHGYLICQSGHTKRNTETMRFFTGLLTDLVKVRLHEALTKKNNETLKLAREKFGEVKSNV